MTGWKTWKYLCPMWMLTKGWPQQKGILIIVWIGLPTQWICQPLFLASPVIAQWLMKKVTMLTELEIMQRLSNMDFYSPRPTWVQPLLSALSGSYRDQHRILNMAPFPRQIDYIRLLPSLKGQNFLLTGLDTYTGYEIVFPARNSLSKTISPVLRGCCMHHHRILQNIASD